MLAHYGKFVAYFRVSTGRQGKSGLGLEAQREAVAAYLNGGRWALVGEFTEVESFFFPLHSRAGRALHRSFLTIPPPSAVLVP
jgi:DNA invertase Pin-like site-specific DNA recombinase